MTIKELITREIENLPEPYQVETPDFIRFLENKTVEKKGELLLTSETSLKKDWLTVEENYAWKYL